MARRKQQDERWITAREATAILRRNSGRDDIPVSYVRSMARDGHVEVKRASEDQGFDRRTNLYRASDVEDYKVRRRDQGKGDTVAARKAGSRRKETQTFGERKQATNVA